MLDMISHHNCHPPKAYFHTLVIAALFLFPVLHSDAFAQLLQVSGTKIIHSKTRQGGWVRRSGNS